MDEASEQPGGWHYSRNEEQSATIHNTRAMITISQAFT